MKKNIALFNCLPSTQTKFVVLGLIVCLFLFSGCTKYIPVIEGDVSKIKSDPGTAPEDLNNWPAERKLLYEIKNKTGIDFSETLPQKMEWRFKQNEMSELVTVDGYLMIAEASDKSTELVNKYLELQGFVFDDYNVADGVLGGQVGYQKENTICTIFSAYSVLSKDKTAKTASDITVRCALFNKP